MLREMEEQRRNIPQLYIMPGLIYKLTVKNSVPVVLLIVYYCKYAELRNFKEKYLMNTVT